MSEIDLTGDDREFLTGLRGGRLYGGDRHADAIERLASRGLVRRYASGRATECWELSEAGEAALIEIAVAERFSAFDRLCICPPTGSTEALTALAKIVRDQERRIAKLEGRG